MATIERDPKNLEIAGRLRQSCRRLGLTDQVMARELRVSRATWQNYLSGRTKPTMELLLKWQRVTGLSLDWLAHGDPAEETFWSAEKPFESLPADVQNAVANQDPWRSRLVFSLNDERLGYPVIDVGEASVYARVIGRQKVLAGEFGPTDDLAEVDTLMTAPYKSVAATGRPYVHEYSCMLHFEASSRPKLFRTVVLVFPVELASNWLLAALSMPELVEAESADF